MEAEQKPEQTLETPQRRPVEELLAARRVDWVIFDLGGVVLTTRDKRRFELDVAPYVLRSGLPDSSALKKRVYDGPEFDDAKVGRISSSEMFRQLYHSLFLASSGASNSVNVPSGSGVSGEASMGSISTNSTQG